MRVLVADDDPLARRLLEVTLTRSGYEVLAVADGVKAWDVLCGQNSPTLALLDWMMPGLTGVDMCRKVREAAPSGPVYLILVTSKGRTEDVVSALRTGADDYITKPFEIEELRARLAVGERLVTLQQQLADRVRALEEALAHVHQLQGLIPICAWCGQVRSDGNYWEQVESYLAKRSGLQFTHAICPPCRVKASAPLRHAGGAET